MITIVSGLPRSGTSLMMQMLQAGGLPALFDAGRPADAHNPRGYLEYAKVKSLARDNAWLAEAEGKALKVVSQLLYHLPEGFEYRVLFLRRELDEILRSQEAMLAGLGQGAGPDRAVMRAHFQRHLDALAAWLAQRPQFQVLDCPYADLIAQPEPATRRVAEFLGLDLNIAPMMQAVDPALYRQRT